MAEQLLILANQNPQTTLVLLLSMLILILIALLFLIWQYFKLRRGLRAYSLILERFGEQEIQAELAKILSFETEHNLRIEKLEKHAISADEVLAEHLTHLKGVIQRVGLVRYNAFPDVAGDQSYSLALLDLHGTGVILTTLHGRAEARTYAKNVIKGASNYPLLPEEQQAIYQATRHSAGGNAHEATAKVSASEKHQQAFLLGRRIDMPLPEVLIEEREHLHQVENDQHENGQLVMPEEMRIEPFSETVTVVTRSQQDQPSSQAIYEIGPDSEWSDQPNIPPPPWSAQPGVKPLSRSNLVGASPIPRGSNPIGAVQEIPLVDEERVTTTTSASSAGFRATSEEAKLVNEDATATDVTQKTPRKP